MPVSYTHLDVYKRQIPTVISGIYGMNVSSKWVPLATTAHGFMIIIGVMVVICVLILILLKKKTGIVPCSNSVFKRLIEIPTRPGTFMLSEELILHFVSKLYPKYVIREKSIMRVTRNADIDAQSMYDEDMDCLLYTARCV